METWKIAGARVCLARGHGRLFVNVAQRCISLNHVGRVIE